MAKTTGKTGGAGDRVKKERSPSEKIKQFVRSTLKPGPKVGGWRHIGAGRKFPAIKDIPDANLREYIKREKEYLKMALTKARSVGSPADKIFFAGEARTLNNADIQTAKMRIQQLENRLKNRNKKGSGGRK